MKLKATLSIVSPEYENVYKVCEESLKKYLPDWDHIKVSTNDPIVQDLKQYYKYTDMGQFICAIRPAIVAHYLADYENILFLGSDVVFFDSPSLLDAIINQSLYNVLVTPHLVDINKAIPSNLLPNITSISKTGHINSDFVLWNEQALNFLLWQAKIHETECVVKDGVFLDQTWLNYLPCFEETSFFKDPYYNCAYWRDVQNEITFKDEIPYLNGERITSFQFSGFVKGDPGKISKHCNYPRATGDYLKFLEWYDKKL